MPNWVTNELRFNSKYDKYFINPDTQKVDFNILKPMPTEFMLISGGLEGCAIAAYVYSTGDGKNDVNIIDYIRIVWSNYSEQRFQTDCNEYLKRKNDHFHSNDEKNYYSYNSLIEVGKRYVDNYRKYRSWNWYDWSIKNWGCKWNAGCCNINHLGYETLCLFDTPWSPPNSFLLSAAKQGIPFEDYWIEEQGYRGCISSNGVDYISEDMQDITYDEDTGEWIDDGCCEKPTIYDSSANIIVTA